MLELTAQDVSFSKLDQSDYETLLGYFDNHSDANVSLKTAYLCRQLVC